MDPGRGAQGARAHNTRNTRTILIVLRIIVVNKKCRRKSNQIKSNYTTSFFQLANLEKDNCLPIQNILNSLLKNNIPLLIYLQ